MKKRASAFGLITLSLAVMSFCCVLTFAQGNAPAVQDQWKSVDQALGRTGQAQPDGAYKFGMPRGDLKVTVSGVEVKPALALGSWLGFSSPGENAMMMGDLVLVEDEVSSVMAKLEQSGVEVTALHNHVLHETPRVMYMHVAGHGSAVRLAQTMKDVLALTKTPAPNPNPAPQPSELGIDTAAIEQALGHKGKVNGGVLQVSVARSEAISERGMKVPTSLGISTAINFQPTGNGKTAITGDFVLLGSEVNPVIRALEDGGIQVTALHSHMLEEQPRLFFMHFWANDDALKLAKGLRAALDKTNSAK